MSLPLAETTRSPSRRPAWAGIPSAKRAETMRAVVPSGLRSCLNQTPRSGGRTIWPAVGCGAATQNRQDMLAATTPCNALRTRRIIGPPFHHSPIHDLLLVLLGHIFGEDLLGTGVEVIAAAG